MVCGNALPRRTVTLSILNVHGQSIKSTNAFKYLGVVLYSTLSFSDHIEHLRKKLSKILGVFSRARPALTLDAANRV